MFTKKPKQYNIGFMETINERLRYIRKQLGLTTRLFADSINLSCSTITNIEKGHRNMTDRTVSDICRVHDVNPEWLVNGTGPVFEDVLQKLNINEDVKALVRQYARLNREDKDLIKSLMNALSEKTRLQQAAAENNRPAPEEWPPKTAGKVSAPSLRRIGLRFVEKIRKLFPVRDDEAVFIPY